VIEGRWLADCDNGPTKLFMVEHRDDDAAHRRLYDLAFAKRPAEELYDLRKDPGQMTNVAGEKAYSHVRSSWPHGSWPSSRRRATRASSAAPSASRPIPTTAAAR